MKNQKLNFVMLLFLAVTLSIFSCDNDDYQLPEFCETDNSSFKQLINDIETKYTAKYHIGLPADGEYNGYVFKLSEDKVVCSIGYQDTGFGQDNIYRIEITDTINKKNVYVGEHTFSKDSLSYIKTDLPVALKKGVPYLITKAFVTKDGGVDEAYCKTIGVKEHIKLLPYKHKSLEILSGYTKLVFGDVNHPNPQIYVYHSNIPIIDVVFY